MNFPSKQIEVSSRERREYGAAKVRDAAFDALMELWRVRKMGGMTQKTLAQELSRDRGWVSKALAGPGNWTLATFGELAEALDGDVEIKVLARETPVTSNYDYYSAIFCPEMSAHSPQISGSNRGVFNSSGPTKKSNDVTTLRSEATVQWRADR